MPESRSGALCARYRQFHEQSFGVVPAHGGEMLDLDIGAPQRKENMTLSLAENLNSLRVDLVGSLLRPRQAERCLF